MDLKELSKVWAFIKIKNQIEEVDKRNHHFYYQFFSLNPILLSEITFETNL